MEYPTGRIHGTEMEWGAMVSQPYSAHQSLLSASILAPYVREELVESGIQLISNSHSNHFLENGARLYNDVEQRWEYATPEDTSYIGTTANEIAGDQIVAQIAERYKAKTGYEISFTKRVIDDNGVGCGYHVSHCLDATKVKISSESLELYGVFAATRSIVFGSGALLPRGRFILGQKALTTNVDFHSGTTADKPVVNLRHEPLASSNSFERLHDTSGDPTMSPWATRVKLGAASIVASMIEHGEDMPNLRLEAPLFMVARNVSRDTVLHNSYRLRNGKSMGALEIQRAIVKQAKRLFKAEEILLGNEELWALHEWEKALGDLKQDPMLTAKRVEWVTRLKLLERQRENHGYAWNSEMLRYKDRQFSEIATKGIAKALRETIWAEYMPNDSLIEKRLHYPPGSSRALVRGNYIKRMANKVTGTTGSVDWQWVVHKGERIMLNNPYETSHDRLDAIA